MTEPILNNKSRRLSALIFAALAFFVLAAAASIPFFYESTTLWYKFGLDRILLRSGQVIGLVNLVFLALQILLVSRFSVLDWIIGRSKVPKIHRQIGLMIVLLALTHALLVLIPEGLNNLPIGWKYWPEIVGAFSLFLLCLQVVSALYRSRLSLSYPYWRRLHMLMGYFIFLAINIHILFVSTSFSEGLPRYALLFFSGTVLLALILRKAASLA